MIKKSKLRRIVDKIQRMRAEKCPKCGFVMKNTQSKPYVYKCKDNLCKHKFNVWKQTIFEKTRISKEKVLRILELWLKKASTDLISYVVGVEKKTIWRVLNNLRKYLVPKYYDSLEQIGGEDLIVEIDESKFGKRKYNRGHHVDGVWVLGLIEKTNEKRIRLYVLDDRKKETLNNYIQSNVEANSTIYTDGWKGYVDLKALFTDHKTVNHSKTFKDPETGVHTNTIEGSWLGVKMHIPLRGRTKEKIELYLVRYMMLKNSKRDTFEDLLKCLFK